MTQLLQSRDPLVQTSGVVRDGEYDQVGFPFAEICNVTLNLNDKRLGTDRAERLLG